MTERVSFTQASIRRMIKAAKAEGYRVTGIEDAECKRLAGVLSGLRFSIPKSKPAHVTTEQAVAVRAKAHERGWHSMGLGQAVQYELGVRQKDAIGEYVPLSEPGPETYVYGRQKWLRGVTWEEINEDLILEHVTSKTTKPLRVKLRLAPMIMEEFALIAGVAIADVTRDMLPASGPLLINEYDDLPWTSYEYRRKWRIIANELGMPKVVKNRHNRQGALHEGKAAGATIEQLQQVATHSDISMTQHYLRDDDNEAKIEAAQLARIKHRAAANDNLPLAANDHFPKTEADELRAQIRELRSLLIESMRRQA